MTSRTTRPRMTPWLHAILSGLLLGCAPIQHAAATDTLVQQIANSACKPDQTVEQALERIIKSHSHYDTGWRVFVEDDYVDIERAVQISKGTAIRYRWRMQRNGQLLSQNERATLLCRDTP